MIPREEHLLDMVDRALDDNERLRGELQEARIASAALLDIVARLARIETAIGLRPLSVPTPAAPMPPHVDGDRRLVSAPVCGLRQRPARRGQYDARVLEVLANGPLSLSDTAQAVLGDDVSPSRTGTIFGVLKRLCLAGRISKRPDRRYERPPAELPAKPSFWTQVPPGESITQRAEKELPRMQEQEISA